MKEKDEKSEKSVGWHKPGLSSSHKYRNARLLVLPIRVVSEESLNTYLKLWEEVQWTIL